MLVRLLWKYARRWKARALRAERECEQLRQLLEQERTCRKTMADGFFAAAVRRNQTL